MSGAENLELYLHIPFCARKCKYCDFLSAPADRQVQNAYMEALIQEVRRRGDELRATADGRQRRVSSIFIGGGTPSVVAPEWIEKLMGAARDSFELTADAEVTMEMNPGTVTADGLSVYKSAGINRLSIGCQSADDAELRLLGRIHTYSQFLDIYCEARKIGFQNINVDLMGALPGQSREANVRNLRELLKLDPIPEHISAYSLIVEEGTPFYDLRWEGSLALPDEETERLMYWDTAEILQKSGYEHYEISNYALPGAACRHNCGYWRRTDYLGFGIGAASLFNNTRFLNGSNINEYIQNPLECRSVEQRLGRGEVMEETMFLGLRMMEGVSAEAFRDQFGETLESVYGDVIEEGIRDGLLEYRTGREGNSRLALTPRGIDLSNYIMAKFLF